MSELVRLNEYIAFDEGLLSNVLSDQCSFFKPDDFQDWLVTSRIKINGVLVDSDVLINKGDLVSLLTPESLEPPVNSDYGILFEDAYLFVVNKPANLPIHPAGKHYFHTLTHLLSKSGFVDSSKLFPVNRLDKETSGLVLFAKSSELASSLQNLFLTGAVEKIYEAIVFGKTEKLFEVDAPLSKKTVGELRDCMCVDSLGFPSKTTFFTLKQSKYYSHLQITLHTGRRHQIRAHLAHIGHSVVGDKQYGAHPELFVKFVKSPSSVSDDECSYLVGASRQLLHCKSLNFIHPVTDKSVFFTANPPKDFLFFLKNSLN